MNKVAFITGASRGIGKATALAFARAGYDLIISARTLEDGERHNHSLRLSDGSALPGSLAGFEFYFAGPPPMTQALQEMLMVGHRVPFEQIHFDRFF